MGAVARHCTNAVGCAGSRQIPRLYWRVEDRSAVARTRPPDWHSSCRLVQFAEAHARRCRRFVDRDRELIGVFTCRDIDAELNYGRCQRTWPSTYVSRWPVI